MSYATIGSILLYLNGVRVPCINASVVYSDSSPATASAQIPWHPILEGLGEEDLIQVALFYLDTVYYDKPTYCLLFEGRLAGYSYQNSGTGETMSLSFESNLMVLNDLSINFTTSSSRSGSTANKDYPNQIDIKSKATSLLTSKFTGSSIKRPFDIIENIIYAVTGTYRDKNKYTDLVDEDKFYEEVDNLTKALTKEYEVKLALLQSEAGDISDSAKEVLQQQAFEFAFREITATGNSLGVPTDRFFTSDQDIRGSVKLAAAAMINRHVKKKASNYRDVVLSGFFARHMRLIRFREHWMCSPYLEGFPGESTTEDESRLGGGVFPMLRSKGAKKFFRAMLRRTGEKMGPQGRVYSLVNNIFSLMFYKIQEIPSPPAYVSSKFSLPHSNFSDYIDSVKVEDSEDFNYSSLYEKVYKDGKHPVIGSYVTAPDVPYAIPPSCNVIFPCQRQSIIITNSTNAAPTRVYYNRRNQLGKLNLSSKSPGYNYDATRVGYPSIAAGLTQKAAGGSVKDLEALVFPEEYYRGPRVKMSVVHPSYSAIQDFANSARFSESKLRAGKATTVYDTDPESVNYSIEAVEAANKKGISSYGLYYMLAQKEYQDARTATRGGNVSTIFNPYIIPGFPCAILSGDNTGMQYYAKVASVSHTLSNQGAATTTIAISHVRDMKDNLKQVVIDKAITDITPADPIKEIRSLLQVSESAEEYYRSLLKRGEMQSVVPTSQSIRLGQEIENISTQIATLEEEFRSYAWGDSTFEGSNSARYNIDQYDEGYASLEEVIQDSTSTQAEFDKAINLQIEAQNFKKRFDHIKDELGGLRQELKYLEANLEALEEGVEFTTGTYSPSSFDLKQFLGWEVSGSSKVKYINILDTDQSTYLREYTDEDQMVWGVPPNSRLVPLPETKRYFTDLNRAMKYNSRPVCTLEEYIHFYGVVDRESGMDEVGRGRGIKGRPRTHSCGAIYYDLIRSFVSGPGLQPGSTVDGNTYYRENSQHPTSTKSETTADDYRASSKVQQEPVQGVLTYLDYNGDTKEFYRFKRGVTVTLDDLPDSRKDWQQLLIDYTSIVESTATAREG